jgi:hypothetical protein
LSSAGVIGVRVGSDDLQIELSDSTMTMSLR